MTSLQHPDRCQVCGTSLPRGIPAWWDAATGQVWCQGCRPGPGPEAQLQEEPARGAGLPAEGELQQRWSRLVGFLHRCLQVGTAEPLTPLDSTRWACLPLDRETALCQGTRRVSLHPDLDRLAGRLRSDQVLYYGWPTLVLDTGQGLAVTPLFVAEMLPPPYTLREVPLLEEPALNPSLVFREPALEALLAEVGELPPLGDAHGLAYWAERAGEALEVAVDSLDPGRLRPDLGRSPGLYNAATVLVAQSPPSLCTLLNELRELQGRSDWTGTAAARLLGMQPSRPSGREWMAAAPVPVDRAWEAALGRVRNEDLAPLAVPAGSGCSRLALAALANAWLDGESILVSAQQEADLEGILALAHQVHSGLLLPTGSRGRREALSTRLQDLLQELEADPQARQRAEAARRELDGAALERQRFQQEEAHRAEVRAALARFQRAEAQAARLVWGADLPERLPDPSEQGRRARSLERAWFLARARQQRFLRSLGAGPQVTLQEVLAWSGAAAEARRALEEAAALPAEDSARREACEAAWQGSSARALAEGVAARMQDWKAALHALSGARSTGPGWPQALQAALPAARGWACDLLELASSLPLEAGLFDLGLLEEAGSCSLAAALPLAYRCRRLALLGDPAGEFRQVAPDPARLRRMARHFGYTWDELARGGLDPRRDSAFKAFWLAAGSP